MLKSYTDALQQRKCFKTSRDGRINSQSPLLIQLAGPFEIWQMWVLRVPKSVRKFFLKTYFWSEIILKHVKTICGRAPTKESFQNVSGWLNKFAESVTYSEQDVEILAESISTKRDDPRKIRNPIIEETHIQGWGYIGQQKWSTPTAGLAVWNPGPGSSSVARLNIIYWER